MLLMLSMWQTLAQAQTRVEVLDTLPAGNSVTLGKRQTFYLHLHYSSDVATQIWARPWFQGEKVNAGSNPSRLYPAGSGEALGWFFLDPGTQVDEVRIRAGDGSTRGTQVVAIYPVSVSGGYASAAPLPQPEWLVRLRAQDKAAQDAAYQKAMSTPATGAEIALFNGFMLLMLALLLIGIGGPLWGLWRWRNGWRLLAIPPALVMGFVVLRIVIDTAFDPTSHNLWPFEIVMWGLFSSGWMLVLVLLRKLLPKSSV